MDITIDFKAVEKISKKYLVESLPPFDKALMIWDGECQFCRGWVNRWKQSMGKKIDFLTSEEMGRHFWEISEDSYRKAVHLIERNGRVSRGAEAVFRAYSIGQGKSFFLSVYRRVPVFAWLSEWFYRLVATNRSFFSKVIN
jgi:predicted DCC family thiol-disulfide oxidoreductase YuxK